MVNEIKIPSFDFSSMYYQQILEALLEFKRVNVPELSDESPQEPLIQLLRAFALVGHLNNTLLDLVANESTLPTSRLPETIRNMLRLIDFELRPASRARDGSFSSTTFCSTHNHLSGPRISRARAVCSGGVR